MLCGEVKLPGTREGQTPLADKLIQDAAAKATNGNVRYFFTWNVNEFALFDHKLWDRPLLERRVWHKKLDRYLADAAAVAREESLSFVKTHFLPDLLRKIGDIVAGRSAPWQSPDDLFITSLNSHLDWPVQLLSAYIYQQAAKNKSFALRVVGWMKDQGWYIVRSADEEWAELIGNMAKTLSYVWANRLIFYKALR